MGFTVVRALRFFSIAVGVAWRAIVDTVAHSGIEYGGYIAFLAILSLFPFIIFTVGILTYLSTTLSLGEGVHDLLGRLLFNIPDDVMSGLKPRIAEILATPPNTLVTLAIVNILWTSSSIIEGLRTVLNIAARAAVVPPYIFRRLLSILQFIFVSSALIASCLLYSAWPLLKGFAGNSALFGFLSRVDGDYAGFILLAIVMLWLYRVLPSRKQNFLAIIIGSGVVILLWRLSVACYSFFLVRFSHLGLIYGSLGSIIISLLFFYILAVEFIFGAELIYQISKSINPQEGPY